MQIKIKLQVATDDDIICDEEVLHLDKPHDQLEAIGLSLYETKALLKQLQVSIVTAQAEIFANQRRHCEHCGKSLLKKGNTSCRFRTPLGDVLMPSPRFYHCNCKPHKTKTFSPLTELFTEHISPELLYLEAKWASLVSYGVTVDLLKEVLPIGATLNAQTVSNHLQAVASRMEADLTEEQNTFNDGVTQMELAVLPEPEGPIVVGIDGGYVRDRSKSATHFEVLVGQSLSEDRGNRYFGLVQSRDSKPRYRLQRALAEQGFQMNQDITFMTDGGDTVRNMAFRMSPCAEHVLDWFHITMRLTVLRQYAKGLIHHNPGRRRESETRY